MGSVAQLSKAGSLHKELIMSSVGTKVFCYKDHFGLETGNIIKQFTCPSDAIPIVGDFIFFNSGDPHGITGEPRTKFVLRISHRIFYADGLQSKVALVMIDNPVEGAKQ